MTVGQPAKLSSIAQCDQLVNLSLINTVLMFIVWHIVMLGTRINYVNYSLTISSYIINMERAGFRPRKYAILVLRRGVR